MVAKVYCFLRRDSNQAFPSLALTGFLVVVISRIPICYAFLASLPGNQVVEKVSFLGSMRVAQLSLLHSDVHINLTINILSRVGMT